MQWMLQDQYPWKTPANKTLLWKTSILKTRYLTSLAQCIGQEVLLDWLRFRWQIIKWCRLFLSKEWEGRREMMIRISSVIMRMLLEDWKGRLNSKRWYLIIMRSVISCPISCIWSIVICLRDRWHSIRSSSRIFISGVLAKIDRWK